MSIILFCSFKIFCFVCVYMKIWFKDVDLIRVNVEDIKVFWIFLVMVLVNIICFLLVIIIEVIDFFCYGFYLLRLIYLFYLIVVILLSLVNLIIYGVMNWLFRKEYICLLCLDNCRMFLVIRVIFMIVSYIIGLNLLGINLFVWSIYLLFVINNNIEFK